MARIAIRAVVDVTANSLMILIGLGFRVTIGAREYGIVRWVCVTSRTDAIRATVACGEPGVIECRALP